MAKRGRQKTEERKRKSAKNKNHLQYKNLHMILIEQIKRQKTGHSLRTTLGLLGTAVHCLHMTGIKLNVASSVFTAGSTLMTS